MSRVDNEVIHAQLNWRYACKKFDPTKKIRESDWNIMAEGLRLTASSYGLQPWKFILVQNPETRLELMTASFGQTPVVDASHFIVFTYKEKLDEALIQKHVDQTAAVRGVDPKTLEAYKNMMVRDLIIGPRSQTIESWAQRQTFLAMGSLLTLTALMEIDSLPMEGIDQAAFNRILRLDTTGYKTIGAMACGYRAADDKYQNLKKVRFNLDDVLEVRA